MRAREGGSYGAWTPTPIEWRNLSAKVDTILAGQMESRHDVEALRSGLLLRYDSDDSLVAGIARRLNKPQLVAVQALVDMLDTNSELETEAVEVVRAVQADIGELSNGHNDVQFRQPVLDVFSDPAIDIKHKLRVSLPIIPLLVGYEMEIALGTGFALPELWSRLVAKISHRPTLA